MSPAPERTGDGRDGAPDPGLTLVPGIRVGHADDRAARTGCTVVLGPFRAAVEVRGHATGSRELDALSPLHVVPSCDAVLLTGGSAFGLSAADGVVQWLEERGRGFPTSAARVPIVPAAVLYDLAVGDAAVRPDPEMGYEAADRASAEPVAEGAVGAGAGATVGKLRGGGSGEPSGVGSWGTAGEGRAVAALAVVNAFGDVVDGSGRILAGARDGSGKHLDSARALARGELGGGFGPGENTTLVVVAVEPPLDERGLQLVARQAMNGLVRRIRPAATLFDGDMVFAVSTGGMSEDGVPDPSAPVLSEPSDLLPLAARAEDAVQRAVERAVTVDRGASP